MQRFRRQKPEDGVVEERKLIDGRAALGEFLAADVDRRGEVAPAAAARVETVSGVVDLRRVTGALRPARQVLGARRRLARGRPVQLVPGDTVLADDADVVVRGAFVTLYSHEHLFPDREGDIVEVAGNVFQLGITVAARVVRAGLEHRERLTARDPAVELVGQVFVNHHQRGQVGGRPVAGVRHLEPDPVLRERPVGVSVAVSVGIRIAVRIGVGVGIAVGIRVRVDVGFLARVAGKGGGGVGGLLAVLRAPGRLLAVGILGVAGVGPVAAGEEGEDGEDEGEEDVAGHGVPL